MNYIQYMKPGSNFWALPNGLEDVSWSEFWNNWKQAIEKAKDQIIDNWENLKQDYKNAADPIAASERKQAESIEATRAKQASMKFVSDNRTDYEKKRDRKNFELKEFGQKDQLNKDATDAVMWTLTGIPYAVQHLASPNGVVKTYGNTKAVIQNGGGPYIEKTVASAAGDVLDATILAAPLFTPEARLAKAMNKNIRNTTLQPTVADEAILRGQLGWAPKQTIPYRHGSLDPELQTFVPKYDRWDVTTHGADPYMYFVTDQSTPVSAANMMDLRPYQYTGNIVAEKPMVQVGDFNVAGKNATRNQLISRARQQGADAYLLQDIVDNKVPHLNVVARFIGPEGEAVQGGALLQTKTTPTKTSLAFFERLPARITEAERLGIPKGTRNNKNIVREVPDSQLDDKIWILKDGVYLEVKFRDIKPGQLFKYDPKDAVSYTYTYGPNKNPLDPDRYLLSDREFLGFDYMSEYSGHGVLKKDSYIYDHIKMQSNSLLHDKLKAIAANIQISPELYALFLNPRYIQSFKQYYLNKGWRVGNLTDEEIAKIIAYNHKLLTSNLTGVAKDVILWNGSGKQMTADGAVVREAAPDNFKIITENLQGGGGDIRGVWFSDFNDALSYGYPKQIGGSRQHTWEGVLLVDILPYLINDARGHMSAGYKFGGQTAPKNLILHSRELVSGDLDNIKGLFPHPDLILLEGNGFTRSWSTKGLHYKKGGSIHIKKKNKGKFTDYCGGKVTEECIRKGKNSSNPTTRKRANFAWVARHKFKHEDGGTINYLNMFNENN